MTAALARIAPASAELAVGLSRSRFNRPVLRRITIEIPGLLSQADMRPHAAKAGTEDWIKPRSAMAAARRVTPRHCEHDQEDHREAGGECRAEAVVPRAQLSSPRASTSRTVRLGSTASSWSTMARRSRPRAPDPIVTEHGHRTGVPRAGALRDLNRRRLGGTVHPEQREDLAMVDLKLTCRTA